MQVAGDAIAVGEHVELTHLTLGGRQLPRQRRLVGEGRHHVELFVGERLRCRTAHNHHDAGDGLGGPQRQHERGPDAGNAVEVVVDHVEPSRGAV